MLLLGDQVVRLVVVKSAWWCVGCGPSSDAPSHRSRSAHARRRGCVQCAEPGAPSSSAPAHRARRPSLCRRRSACAAHTLPRSLRGRARAPRRRCGAKSCRPKSVCSTQLAGVVAKTCFGAVLVDQTNETPALCIVNKADAAPGGIFRLHRTPVDGVVVATCTIGVRNRGCPRRWPAGGHLVGIDERGRALQRVVLIAGDVPRHRCA